MPVASIQYFVADPIEMRREQSTHLNALSGSKL